MAICSKCRRRLILWIALTVVSIGVGLLLDLIMLKTTVFPFPVRLAGLTGVILFVLSGNYLSQPMDDRIKFLEYKIP